MAPELDGVHAVDRRIPVSVLNFAWHRLGWPPAETLIPTPIDVTHSLHPLLLPARAAARVITIHDLNFLAHPERTRAEIRRDYPVLVREHAHRADAVIVPSHFTAAEVERQLGVPAERITVCSPGAPDWDARGPASGRRICAVSRDARASKERRHAARRVRATGLGADRPAAADPGARAGRSKDTRSRRPGWNGSVARPSQAASVTSAMSTRRIAARCTKARASSCSHPSRRALASLCSRPWPRACRSSPRTAAPCQKCSAMPECSLTPRTRPAWRPPSRASSTTTRSRRPARRRAFNAHGSSSGVKRLPACTTSIDGRLNTGPERHHENWDRRARALRPADGCWPLFERSARRMGGRRQRSPARVRALRARGTGGHPGCPPFCHANRAWSRRHLVGAGPAASRRRQGPSRRPVCAGVHGAAVAHGRHRRGDSRSLLRRAPRVVRRPRRHPPALAVEAIGGTREGGHHDLAVLAARADRTVWRRRIEDSRDSSRDHASRGHPTGSQRPRKRPVRGLDLQSSSCAGSDSSVRADRASAPTDISRHRRRRPQRPP